MLSLTSFIFLLALLISIGLYYVVPKRFQWVILLIYSLLFFFGSSKWYTFLYLLANTGVTYLGSRIIVGNRVERKKIATTALVLTIVVSVGMLVILKYMDLGLFAPIGISFYTVQTVGYILDVYWGTIEYEKNLLKLLLFIGYWPQLTSGPIEKYTNVGKQLFGQHSFEWKNVTWGLQRILWGIFKKLVISERAAIIVLTVYNNLDDYNGFYIWLAAGLFMVQLYTDFSGCMDIIIGASECYGVILSENFRSPFFSKTVQEYWQRWHITLGGWLRDYILFPLLNSKAFKKITKILQKHTSKKVGRQLSSFIGTLCVWLLIGVWHGGGIKFILGMGLWFWGIIVLETVLEPYVKRLTDKANINRGTRVYHFFQSVKVFIIVMIGNMFFRLSSVGETFYAIRQGVCIFNIVEVIKNLFNLGLDWKEFTILATSVVILVIVSYLQETCSIRERLSQGNVIIRWLVIDCLILSILVFGKYGYGFTTANFIYGGF